jgi:hypothetical protein
VSIKKKKKKKAAAAPQSGRLSTAEIHCVTVLEV